MYVKKFEADTLEEALKAVKLELGPDAIILKTITNNGLKGAFKKKRIEITAAISEQNFEKKAKVDKVLNNDQKEALYQKSASNIKETINKYHDSPNQASGAGYGTLGLNKVVNTLAKSSSGLAEVTTKTTSMFKSSLDDFLSDDEETQNDSLMEEPILRSRPKPQVTNRGKYAEPPQAMEMNHPIQTEDRVELKAKTTAPAPMKENVQDLKMELKTQQHKIDLLEKKIHELLNQQQYGQRNQQEATGVYQLRTTLKTLDIDDAYIMDLIKKAHYHLSKEELDNPDSVFEFCLQDMASTIKTDIPLFAKVNHSEPVATILLSETSSGQSTMGMKIAVLKKDVVFIQYSADAQNAGSTDFAAQVFGIKVEKLQSLAEVITISRKAIESGKSVLVDLKVNNKTNDETKKFVETFKRTFKHVEVLCTLSAIHSELFNRKILARYKDFTDGVIISHVDLCLNFGALFNIHKVYNKIPLKFFGTGAVVPDDLEGATAERLMSGLFQF